MKPSFLSELSSKVGPKAGTMGFKTQQNGGGEGYGRVVSARLSRAPSGVGGAAKEDSPNGGNKWQDIEVRSVSEEERLGEWGKGREGRPQERQYYNNSGQLIIYPSLPSSLSSSFT